jgi:hypothetical protein
VASRQSYELVDLFKRLSGAIAANPNMFLGEMGAVFEHLGDATAEPRGVDYIEVDAAGIAPCGRFRRIVPQIASCCVRTVVATFPDQCTRTGKCTRTMPRRLAAGRSS